MKNTQQQAQQALRAIQTRQEQAASVFQTTTDANIAEVKAIHEQVQAHVTKLSDQMSNLDNVPEHLEDEHDALDSLGSEVEALIGELEELRDAKVDFSGVIGEELLVH
ncbi:hypothetical protein [Deinococcus frigens]|uniref:hypothetical protein n=1 Tax=Deinococcus frigens TaxID=249403 RepID=UPI000496BA55|nr:hypothetical protein [Deinococcus frigens]